MSFLQRKTTWSNADLYIFKLGVFAAGVLLGAYAEKFILPYMGWFWVLAIVGCISAGYFWISKSKK